MVRREKEESEMTPKFWLGQMGRWCWYLKEEQGAVRSLSGRVDDECLWTWGSTASHEGGSMSVQRHWLGEWVISPAEFNFPDGRVAMARPSSVLSSPWMDIQYHHSTERSTGQWQDIPTFCLARAWLKRCTEHLPEFLSFSLCRHNLAETWLSIQVTKDVSWCFHLVLRQWPYWAKSKIPSTSPVKTTYN